MTADEAAAAVAKMIAKAVERIDLFAFEYASGNTALAVMQEADRLSQSLLNAKSRDESAGASVWRTRKDSDPSRWFVIVCDEGLGLRDRPLYGAGVPYELDERTRVALIERHLTQKLTQFDPQTLRASYRAHYGLGAELRRGGEIRQRIGRDM